MSDSTERAAVVQAVLPPQADQETLDLMAELDRLQTWTTLLMTRQIPKAMEAYDLVQRTRCYIVERNFPKRPDHIKGDSDDT